MSATSKVLPPRQRMLVTIVTMTATLIVILDTTIANVALPHMQASLNATADSISWVLTSYILASAVALPLTGYLSNRLGRRTLFTAAIVGFTVSSAVCGLAISLPMMVAARLIQGLCGAFLAPMSQAILYDINPPEKTVGAMTVWGMVIMVGPIMGPVLGGWITDNFNWRWVFYVNVPIGIAAALGSWLMLSDETAGAIKRFDYQGFIFLALGLSGLQLMLDRGVQVDWFDAWEIWIELGVSVAAFWMFTIHTITTKHSLVPRSLFTDRNFVTALGAIAVLGGILMAGAALVAPMLQRMFGYPVFQAGLLTAPRGIGTVIGMVIAGRLSGKVDPRLLIATGMCLLAVSLWMMTGFSLEMDADPVIWSGAVQGVGLGLTVLPLNLLALATLSSALRTEAAALYNLMRAIGGSIAISLMTALISANTQVVHADLGADISTTRVPFLNAGIFEQLGVQGQSVLRILDMEINRQALMVAYVDDYWAMMWAAVLVVPLVLLLRGPKPGEKIEPIADAH